MTPKELLEYAVIGDFLNDVVPPADIRELARRHGVCTEDFGNPDLAKVFAIAMEYAGNTNETLLGELHAKGVSQLLCEEAIRHSAATMMDCEMNLCLSTVKRYSSQHAVKCKRYGELFSVRTETELFRAEIHRHARS